MIVVFACFRDDDRDGGLAELSLWTRASVSQFREMDEIELVICEVEWFGQRRRHWGKVLVLVVLVVLLVSYLGLGLLQYPPFPSFCSTFSRALLLYPTGHTPPQHLNPLSNNTGNPTESLSD